MRSVINSKGQVWVETVIYTLIGLTIIGLVLAAAMPRINQKRDEAAIEASIEVLGEINEKIYKVIDKGVGNRRALSLKIKSGAVVVDMDEESISWVLDSSFAYSEPGVPVFLGNVEVNTTEKGGAWIVELKIRYDVDLRYRGENTGEKIFDVAPAPYDLLIENYGIEDSNLVVMIG